ncbi:MAG: 7-carboxy-7-deazaguanine synthase [Thermoleophilia bacterium]
MKVFEIFESLQGEGLWSGAPMTFVRLAGCNAPEQRLACVRWCDTPESRSPAAGMEMTAEQVEAAVRLPRVCITGGEPLLQAEELVELAGRLRSRGRRVHLETNGVLDLPPELELDWVTVSPKPPAYEVSDSLGARMDELKLVVDEDFSLSAADDLHRRFPDAVFFLQPESGAGLASVRRAVDLVLQRPAWRLSVQLHKTLGLP